FQGSSYLAHGCGAGAHALACFREHSASVSDRLDGTRGTDGSLDVGRAGRQTLGRVSYCTVSGCHQLTARVDDEIELGAFGDELAVRACEAAKLRLQLQSRVGV